MSEGKTKTERARPVIGGLTITVVQRIHEPVFGDGEDSIGEAIDAHLQNCAKERMEVQEVKFEMEPEHWHLLAESYRNHA